MLYVKCTPRSKDQITDDQFGSKELLRIHVKGAINRIKSYRILKSVLPITVVHSCDDIVRTCAGLCNLKSLLFKNSITAE